MNRTRELSVENFAPPVDRIDRVRSRALIVGLVGAAACVAGWFVNPSQFFQSYLVGYLYWASIGVGCLAIAMLHHLSRGDWGLMIRRVLEAGARTLPWLLLLFVPIVFGMKDVFRWARPEVMEASELLKGKEPFLNVPFFVARTIGYFAIWSLLAFVLSRLSGRQDSTGDPGLFRKMQAVSAPGLILYCLLATFAGVDWLMSLHPEWFSSLYGVYFLGSNALGALAFTVVVTYGLSSTGPMDGVLSPRIFNALARLMLAFLMLWGYFTLSQFLIIWSGNLPEEVIWYAERTNGGWRAVVMLLVALHFFVPFFALISGSIKAHARQITAVAMLILVMRFVDLFWQAAPNFGGGFHFHWLDVVAPVAVGGLWVWLFLGELKKRSLLPVHDPYLKEALARG